MANEPLVFDVGKEMPPYWQALGQFMSSFAVIESMLMTAIWSLAKIDIPTGRALLQGMHVDQLTNVMKCLLKIRTLTPETEAAVNDMLKRLGAINRVRNEIVHYGMTLNAGGKMISNAKRATGGGRNEIRISPSDLDLMSQDLAKMNWILLSLIPGVQVQDDPPIDMLTHALREPWRYNA